MARCVFCGMDFCEDIQSDVAEHQKSHQRKILAEEKFGHIASYSEREALKDKAMIMGTDLYNIGGERLTYYAHWCRSVEACNYDLKHPNLSEYIMLRQTGSNLMRGSYVNMKAYKEATLLKSYLLCTKSGLLAVQIDDNKYNASYSVIYVEEGSRFEIIANENETYTDGLNIYQIKLDKNEEIILINPEASKSLTNNHFEAYDFTINQVKFYKLDHFGKFIKIDG